MIDKCLFPVAGFGTRFLPSTKAVPKELFPVKEKPLVHHALDEAYFASMRNFCFITNKYKTAIESYFDSSSELHKILSSKSNNFVLNEIDFYNSECNFHYIEQLEIQGLGDAISLSKNFMGNDTFAVILPDDFCISNSLSVLQQLNQVHREYPDFCIVALEEVEENRIPNYGIVNFEKLGQNTYLITDLIEKPNIESAPSNLAIVGRYILTKEIFDAIERSREYSIGEVQITDALNILAKKEKVIGVKFDAKRFDYRNVSGYLVGNIALYK